MELISIMILNTTAIIGTHIMAKMNPGRNWYLAYALILTDGFIVGCMILR